MEQEEKRVCSICGEPIGFSFSPRVKYCSDGCRKEANRIRAREQHKNKKPEQRTKLIKNKGIPITHWVIQAIVPTRSTMISLLKSANVKFKTDRIKIRYRNPADTPIITIDTVDELLSKIHNGRQRVYPATLRTIKKLRDAMENQEYLGRKFNIEYHRAIGE